MNRLTAAALVALLLSAGAATAFAAETNAAVTAGSGSTMAQGRMGDPERRDVVGDRATAALNTLEAKGYTQFKNFHPAGSHFAATVTEKGRKVVVTIDPAAHAVTPKS